jgi:hypothetical protein
LNEAQVGRLLSFGFKKKIFHVLLLNKQNPLKVLSTLVAERSKKSKNVELIKLGNLSK